jgi:glutathione S-transferase
MLKLYGPTNKISINTLKIRVALAEAGAAYEYIPVDLTKGQQRDPAYLALNPHGKVPLLVDGTFALPESDAILWYVAESFPAAQLLGPTPRDRARALEWCDFASTGFYAAYYDLHAHALSLPPDKRIPSVAESARQRVTRCLGVLETVLAERMWLAGSYSIADLANAVVLRGLRERLPDAYHALGSPSTEGWFARVTSRPAWKSALEG